MIFFAVSLFSQLVIQIFLDFLIFLLCTNEIVRLADPQRVCGCVVRHLASAFSLKDNMNNGVAPQ